MPLARERSVMLRNFKEDTSPDDVKKWLKSLKLLVKFNSYKTVNKLPSRFGFLEFETREDACLFYNMYKDEKLGETEVEVLPTANNGEITSDDPKDPIIEILLEEIEKLKETISLLRGMEEVDEEEIENLQQKIRNKKNAMIDRREYRF